MNNEYKKAFRLVAPSDNSIERILNMTTKKRISFKPILAAAMAVAIVLSVNMFNFGRTQSDNPSENTSTNTSIFGGLVIMASAAESNSSEGNTAIVYKELKMNESFPYEMYIKAVDTEGMSKDERNEVFDRLEEEYHKQLNNRTIPWNTSCFEAGLVSENVVFMSMSMGSLRLNIENAEDVSEITVTNTSKYGNWVYNGWNLDSETLGEIREENGSLKPFYPQTPITFTSEEFNFENHNFFWEETEELYSALENDISIPFSTFNDEITFTVKYKNGDIAKSVILLEFNDNGSATIKVVE